MAQRLSLCREPATLDPRRAGAIGTHRLAGSSTSCNWLDVRSWVGQAFQLSSLFFQHRQLQSLLAHNSVKQESHLVLACLPALLLIGMKPSQ